MFTKSLKAKPLGPTRRNLSKEWNCNLLTKVKILLKKNFKNVKNQFIIIIF